ncbi:MAG: carboxypeptidase regulatory-like domain-containing protein [Acidobacteriota bacterium]|nr:carboxypeptidase regulatory-like domain-containing protein [Blastocatellia bacterium]MDW8411718.1 carboxypeptidase regulatory-like domain-containing protein [Acidobacteriota bacterium]
MNGSAKAWLRPISHLTVSAVLVFSGLALFVTPLWAQSQATGGQIVGQVTDTSNAAISGAEVTVRNKDTNYTRTTTTDEAGRYAVPLLPVGPYEIKVVASGFEAAAQEVLVTLGSSINASFSLKVGATSDVVEISASQTTGITLEPTRSSAQAIINTQQIQNLPANGRRFQDFLLLTPTVTIEPERNGLSIAGQRGINININIDGADYNQPFFGGIRGGERAGFAFTVSQEAIQEFQVARNSFSAEFGRSTGGVVNVITKSGTNEFHGSVFYLIRDAALQMEDALGRKPVGRQQQFGGSMGGPIKRNQTFFFTAVDIQKATEPLQVKYTALDVQNLRNTELGQLFVSVAKEGPFNKTNDAQAILGRIDHRMFNNHTLSGRFNFSNNTGENATSAGGGIELFTNRALSNNGTERNRTYTTVIQLNSVFTNTFLNEFRFQYAYEERPRVNNATGPEVNVRNAGALVGVYGQRAFLPITQFDDRYQVSNNATYIWSGHTTKFGFDFNRVFVDQIFRGDNPGVYTFNSLADWAARRPAQFRQFVGSGKFTAAQKELAFFVQDEYRIRPNITLNLGFRYEGTFNPDLLPATAPERRFPGATKISDDLKQYQPRFGVSWDVQGKGKLVLRMGAGRFVARTPLLLFNQAITNNGGNPERGFSIVLNSFNDINNAFRTVGIDLSKASLSNLPAFTEAQLAQLFKTPLGAPVVAFFDPNFRNPRATQFNVSADYKISEGIIAGINFQYINTTQAERLRDVNLPLPVKDATGRNIYSNPRPDPRFSIVRIQEASARSMYRAATLSLNVRRPKYVFDAYYTVSGNYSDDDNERNFAGIQYDDANDLANEFGFSRIDQRHQFTSNGAFQLPYGLQISGIVRLASARPFSGNVGADVNRDGQFSDRAIINGRVLRRNTFRNYGFADASLRVQRAFNVPGEKGKVTFSAEFFNVFNFDNPQAGGPALIFGPGTIIQGGRPVYQPPSSVFRRIRGNDGKYLLSTTLSDPMAIQLGVRYTF